MANQKMPTPTGELDNSLTQLDWAQRPLNYRFEIVAMNATIMAAVMGSIAFEDWPSSFNYEANVVARVDLAVNPQKYMVDEGTRQNVTQTVAGAWVDAYGLGLPKISMSGTTGWNPKRKRSTIPVNLATIRAAQATLPSLLPPPSPTGLQDFILLRNNIFRLYAVLLQNLKLSSLQSVQSALQLRFYAWDTQDYFIVLMDDFKLIRNSARPMMYDYDIAMTVIGYPDQRPSVQDALAKAYNNPVSRFGAILKTLNNWISIAEGAEAAVQNFEASIASDIASVTNDITSLSQAITTGITGVVVGAEGIINAPFSILNSITLALRNIADNILTVEQLPQAFLNDLRAQILETTCAVYGLATYPALFQASATAQFGAAPWGNSGCSSTMGVPPSPISSLAGISIPGVPASPSGLPTDMTFPTVPLALSATSSPQPTAASRPKQVAIQDGDTVESIIAKQGGLNPDVASVWQQIATLNDLEYPYIVANSEFQTNIFATGTVIFYGAPGSVVPQGTRVAYTPPSGTPIYFIVNVSVTLGSNGQGSVGVTAEAPGSFSNIGPLLIDEILDALGNPLTISGVTGVSNANDTTGGRIWKVLRPGDTLLFPVLANAETQEPYLDRTPDNDQNLFGIDILLDETGDFVSDASGDLRTVAGLDNMEVAVLNRLKTEPTELIKHPDYGLNLVRLVGEPGDINAATLMKIEMKATLLQDTRIKNVKNVAVIIASQEMNVNANLTLIDEKTATLDASRPI